jgi:hypothetical protein
MTSNLEPTKPPSALAVIFSSGDFAQVGKATWKGKVNGKKYAIALATYNKSYSNFALNKADLNTVLDLKSNGTYAEAYVVYAKRVEGKLLYVDEVLAEELKAKLDDVEPIHGPYGPFYPLRGPAGSDWEM